MFEIVHNGFIARLSIDGNLIRGEVRDTHEPLIVEGQSVAELKTVFASKIEDYCSLCERRGISPFNTPDGKSSVGTDMGWADANTLIDASHDPRAFVFRARARDSIPALILDYAFDCTLCVAGQCALSY